MKLLTKTKQKQKNSDATDHYCADAGSNTTILASGRYYTDTNVFVELHRVRKLLQDIITGVKSGTIPTMIFFLNNLCSRCLLTR